MYNIIYILFVLCLHSWISTEQMSRVNICCTSTHPLFTTAEANIHTHAHRNTCAHGFNYCTTHIHIHTYIHTCVCGHVPEHICIPVLAAPNILTARILSYYSHTEFQNADSHNEQHDPHNEQ